MADHPAANNVEASYPKASDDGAGHIDAIYGCAEHLVSDQQGVSHFDADYAYMVEPKTMMLKMMLYSSPLVKVQKQYSKVQYSTVTGVTGFSGESDPGGWRQIINMCSMQCNEFQYNSVLNSVTENLYLLCLADPAKQGAALKTPLLLTNQFIELVFLCENIFTAPCLMVEDGAFSHKTRRGRPR